MNNSIHTYQDRLQIAMQKEAGISMSRYYIFLFLFSILSGVLRKWVFVDNSAVGNIILLVQLACPFFVLLWLNKLNNPVKKPVFITYFFLLLLLALNPMNMTIMHGVLGFLLHFGFWLLTGFYLYNTNAIKTEKLINVAVIFSIVEIVLGFIQYSLPSTHFLNRYADTTQIGEIAKAGGYVRIAGTFSYLGGFYSFMLFFNFLLWALLIKKYNGFLLAILALSGLAVALMTASRSTVYTYIFLLVLMLITEGRNAKTFSRLLLQFLVVVLLIVTTNFFLGDRLGIGKKAETAQSNFDKRVDANRRSGEEKYRILKPVADILFFPGEYPLLGVGLGATYQGATAIFGTSSYVEEFGYYEEEGSRILLEGGFVLYIFRVVLFVFLYRRLRIPAFTKGVILIYVFFFIPLIFNIYNSIFFFLGLLLLDNTYAERKKEVVIGKKTLYRKQTTIHFPA